MGLKIPFHQNVGTRRKARLVSSTGKFYNTSEQLLSYADGLLKQEKENGFSNILTLFNLCIVYNSYLEDVH